MNLDYPTLNRPGARKRLAELCLAALITAGAGWTCGAQTTNNTDSAPSLQSFRIINENNIFDPNRYRHGDKPPTQRRVEDTFALVGTMSYPKGTFAFFDGSQSQYKKVLETGGNIAGYTVKDVTRTNVLLVANGKEITMNVGSQMRKEEGSSGWKLSDHVEPAPSTDSNTDTTTVDYTTVPKGENAEQDEALKRLMQLKLQEQQQLNSK